MPARGAIGLLKVTESDGIVRLTLTAPFAGSVETTVGLVPED